MRNLFDYTDYRRFLSDFLESKKSEGGPWSHRYLQQKLGVKSAGYLSNILSGKKNMSEEVAHKIAELVGLKKREQEYFLALVGFNQATTIDERNRYFRTLREFSLGRSAHLTPDRHSLFKRWYYVALVELVQCPGVGVDPEQIAKHLQPNPGFAAVRDALIDLEKWGFIQRQQTRFVRAEPTLTTGDDIQSLAVANFQKETIDLAREAMDRFDLDERDVSCLTLALSEESLQKLKQEIRNFRKKLLLLSEEDLSSDRVVQCNFQVYPIASKAKKS